MIKGETSHDQYIAQAVAHGLIGVTLATGIPAAFGVLTVDTADQAEDRAGGSHGNKGAEAMAALLDAVQAIDALRLPETRGKGTLSGFGRVLPDKALVKSRRSKGRGKR